MAIKHYRLGINWLIAAPRADIPTIVGVWPEYLRFSWNLALTRIAPGNNYSQVRNAG
jgi:hypothetical protein